MLETLRIVSEKGFLDTCWDDLEYTVTPELSVALVEIGDANDPHRPLVAFVRYVPGARVPPHFHDTDYCSIVVDGEIEITRRRHGPGSIRVVKAHTAYGPLVVGPDGCRVIDIFADHRGIAATFLGAEGEAMREQIERDRPDLAAGLARSDSSTSGAATT